MAETKNRLSANWLVATLCLAAATDAAAAGSFTRGCAARDMQVLAAIEEREDANALSAEKSADAVLEIMNARIICHEGHVFDALAMYDAILEDLAVDPVVSKR